MPKFTISKTKKVILSAMFLTILIILGRFLSIKSSLLVISFSFIPIMLSAIYLGPKYTTMIAALGDLIGALLFPFGPYFFGFTFSSGLMGMVYGLFLYKTPEDKSEMKFLVKLIISSIIVLFGIKIFIEAYWLYILYQKAYLVVISTRLMTQTILLPIQVVIIYVLEKTLRPFTKKYLYDEVEGETK